ncbi:DUF1624 domain-containing protein [Pedobacter alpinus]|uniref:DUF1624 domain-containing protein n=1 Tax=Pedobacter alpinus TaxID=1590643 RepID=A0ABW5TT19_9SPHI
MDHQHIIKKRIESIDMVRGVVMVLMALDHVRDYFHIAAKIDDPLNLKTTTTLLFFTRFTTHFCAPTFVLLSGTSIYLQSLIKSKKELSLFLITRGLWLIFAEFFIISFAWTFDPFYHTFILQVIWAIGISMVILGFLVFLPYRTILSIGLVIVLGHNLLDFLEASSGFKASVLLDFLHSGNFKTYRLFENHKLFIAYPFLPWTGLMMMGYALGRLYQPNFNQTKRVKILKILGLFLLLFFIVLRFVNIYGDPKPWTLQKDDWVTFLSFIDVHKYPPSLLYMSITIGFALLFLAFTENIKNRFTNTLLVFGRTAFFYYILHLYFIHFFSVVIFSLNEIQTLKSLQLNFPTEGYNLPGVYIVWITLILILYPICRWYKTYKSKNKDKWWLSYL